MSCINNHSLSLFTLLASLVCLFSCQTPDVIEADLTNLKGNEHRLSAEEVYVSVQATALETSQQCLLSYPSLIAFTDSDMMVTDRNEILRFGRDGTYKNHIGVYGHGEGEHGALSGVSYDADTHTVYVFSPPNEVIKYDTGGHYLGRFAMDGGADDMFLSSCWSKALGLYVAETRLYKDKGVQINIRTYTSDGQKRDIYSLYSDNLSLTTNFIRGSKLRLTHEGVFVMAPYDNTVYLLGQEGLTPKYIIDRGQHTPTRELVENADLSYRLEKHSYYIDNMIVTPRYIYLYITANQGYNDVLIRREDGAVVHNCHYAYNDETKHIHTADGRQSFWPWCSHGGSVATLVDNDDDVEANPSIVVAVEK